MMKLKHSEVKPLREKYTLAQGNRCALCFGKVLLKDRVLDHCHKTGHVRAMLHYDCNMLLGKVENYIHGRGKRLDTYRLKRMLELMYDYMKDDYSANPIHPTFLTPKDKLQRKYKRLLNKSKRAETKRKYRKLLQEIKE